MKRFFNLFRFTSDHLDIIKEEKYIGRVGWFFLKDTHDINIRYLNDHYERHQEKHEYITMLYRLAYSLKFRDSTLIEESSDKAYLYLQFGHVVLWEDEVISISVDEPIVKDFLYSFAKDNVNAIVSTVGDLALWAQTEHCIASRFLDWNEQSLEYVFNNFHPYGLEDTVSELFKFKISAECCVFMGDVPMRDWIDNVINSQAKKVIFPTHICGPDVIVLCQDEEDRRCLITIQVKTYNSKLSNEQFLHAIATTSTFFSGSKRPVNTEPLIADSNILWIRILVITSGFTQSQLDLVEKHNQKHPTEFILLVSPTEDEYWEDIYGDLGSKLKNNFGQPKKTKKSKKILEEDLTLKRFQTYKKH